MVEEADPGGMRIAAGLMSGTSADGVDAALVRIEGSGPEVAVELLACDTLKYSPSVRQRLLNCMRADAGDARELTLLDSYVGELFAHTLLHVCKKASISPHDVSVAGSHGQTFYHHPLPVPFPGFSVSGTLQVGNPAIIAERTEITVVSDFRSRDMAAGGQGAPLAPYLDYVLYRHASRGRIILNIGGLSNLTALMAGCGLDGVTAFDTGPGNCLLDLAAWHYSGGKKTFDAEGIMSVSGRVDPGMLAALLEHPFLRKAPPKSADKDDFGPAFLDPVLLAHPQLAPADVMATLAAFTVRCITSASLEHCFQKGRFEELIVSGGGTMNRAIMDGLRAAFPKLLVSTSDDYAIPSQAKEAVLMAVLADATMNRWPSNVPSATGARRAVVLGSITPASPQVPNAPPGNSEGDVPAID